MREGLDWVCVEPRSTDADFRGAPRIRRQGDLKRMILEDKLGQIVDHHLPGCRAQRARAAPRR